MPQFTATTTTYSLTTTQRPAQKRESTPTSIPSKENISISLTGQAGLALGVVIGTFAIFILILMTMRLKHGLEFTLRSLFSRRFRRRGNGKLANHSSVTDNNDSASILQTARSKELEILGLLSDPRKESPPQTRHSPYIPASTLNTTIPNSPLVIFPTVPDSECQDQKPDAISSRRRRESLHPPSPLLPPSPSLWLPLPASRPVVQESAAAENNVPPSPSPTYRTFATRSSGIFPWGTEPYAMEDGPVTDTLSEDQVLVLPSPPRFTHSHAYGGGVRG